MPELCIVNQTIDAERVSIADMYLSNCPALASVTAIYTIKTQSIFSLTQLPKVQ